MTVFSQFFSDLTPKQRVALPMVAAGVTAVAIEAKTGISASTISEWINNSNEFQNALEDLQNHALNLVAEGLAETSLLALSVMRDLIVTSKSEMVRVRACEFVLNVVLDRR